MTVLWAHSILGILLVAPLPSAGDDWPRFRGPNGSGVSDTKGLPVEFGPSKNVVWKTAVPFSRSSPVITGDRIFLTAAEGEKLITLCLQRQTGRIVWRREITRRRTSPVYKLNDSASPSPVTDGKNVYVFFPVLGLVSYDPNGNERWRVELGPFDTFYGLGSSPVLSGDTLLLNCDTRTNAFLIAVDSADGRIRWRAERPQIRFEGFASPILCQSRGGAAQVIVLGAKSVDAYNVATGEHEWWVRGLGSLPVGSPVIAEGLAVVDTFGSDTPEGPSFDDWLKSDVNKDGRLSREELQDFDEFGAIDRNGDGFIDRDEWDMLRNMGLGTYGLIAVRLGGSGDVTQSGVVWQNKKASRLIPTSLAYKGVLYMVKTGGIITSMDPTTGREFKVDRAKSALGEYYASPVAADGKVIFTSEEGKVTVLKAGAQWDILAVNDVGEECYATPAIASGRIYIRTRSALYCFGKK